MAPKELKIAGQFIQERRRRERLSSETTGWLLPQKSKYAMHMPSEEEGWEVRVFNLSRLGVGFLTSEPLETGNEHRLRIGRGPMSRARMVRVAFCRQTEQGFLIGAEFGDIAAKSLNRAG